MKITLSVNPTDDPEITCIICHGDGCDLEIPARSPTTRTSTDAHLWIGIHRRCASYSGFHIDDGDGRLETGPCDAAESP